MIRILETFRIERRRRNLAAYRETFLAAWVVLVGDLALALDLVEIAGRERLRGRDDSLAGVLPDQVSGSGLYLAAGEQSSDLFEIFQRERPNWCRYVNLDLGRQPLANRLQRCAGIAGNRRGE